MCSPLKFADRISQPKIWATANEIERGYQILSTSPYKNDDATDLVVIIGSNIWQAFSKNWL